MPSKQDELRWHEEAYRGFRSLVEPIDELHFEEKWLDGRWGVRELVGHLAGWHRELGTGLERMLRGERPSPEGVDWTDIQHWNDIFAAEVRDKSKAQVMQVLDDQVTRFRRLGEQLPESRFGPGKTTSAMFERAGTTHFRLHGAMIADWLERVAA
jgi:hypothetical protein